MKIDTYSMHKSTKDRIKNINKLLKNKRFKNKLRYELVQALVHKRAEILEEEHKIWKEKKDYDTKALLINVPVHLGTSEFIHKLRQYLNKDVYSMALRWRGGRKKSTSKVNNMLWDLTSPRRFFTTRWYGCNDITALTAERASIYIKPKERSKFHFEQTKEKNRITATESVTLLLEILENVTDI
jgi:hypothetical protein